MISSMIKTQDEIMEIVFIWIEHVFQVGFSMKMLENCKPFWLNNFSACVNLDIFLKVGSFKQHIINQENLSDTYYKEDYNNEKDLVYFPQTVTQTYENQKKNSEANANYPKDAKKKAERYYIYVFQTISLLMFTLSLNHFLISGVESVAGFLAEQKATLLTVTWNSKKRLEKIFIWFISSG